MEDPVIQFFVLKNGVPASISVEEAQKLIGAIEKTPTQPTIPDTPVVTAPVFGSSRVLEGANKDGQNVYSSASFPYLLLVIPGKVDTFVPKGTNYEYTPLPGRSRLTGADTAWSGNTPPAGFVQPKGYRKCYFKDKSGKPQPDQAYYEQSDEPDEVLDAVVINEPVVVVPPVTQSKPNPPAQTYDSTGDIIGYAQ